jgi:hypothetical protein
MTIKKRTTAGLLTSATTTLPTLGLGAKFGRLVAIRARNYASSAKLAAGADVLVKLKITDNNSDVVFLDAADKDYATAELTLYPIVDDTVTGLGIAAVDATGAAAAAGESAGVGIVLESPVTVQVLNGATVTDYFECQLIVDVG